MLSGIKIGKRKRKEKPPPDDRVTTSSSGQTTATTALSSSSTGNKDNYSAAEEIRRQLMSCKSETEKEMTPVDRLAVSKRITTESKENDTVVLHGVSASPSLQREDLRHGSRKGKLKTPSQNDMTISEMIAEETKSRSMDDVYARNVLKLGSRFKGKELKRVKGASSGLDDEDYAGDGGVDVKLYTEDTHRLTAVAQHAREMSRQIHQHKRENAVFGRCWWWMESPSFEKHRLLSLGNYVSLVLAPVNLSLGDGHCYLVPIKHAESFRSCEDEVWEEVQRFRSGLRNMLAKENKGVLFMETVLPSKGIWQTKMEAIPVPKEVEQDAPMYFKSALTEQAEEWGTHNKILSTRPKGLVGTIPKSFPYFNVEWDDGGYVQIIETSLDKDFGSDIVASMLGSDPVRFQRKKRVGLEVEKKKVLEFCERFKPFDWTYQLD